jgi:Protein of unknown function (DUF3040)
MFSGLRLVAERQLDRTPVTAEGRRRMPLSDREQRVLEQMERALLAEDPKFASSFRGPRIRPATRRRLVLSILGVLGGLAVLSSAVVVPQISRTTPLMIVIALVGFAIMLGCAYVAVISLSRPAPVPPAGQSAAQAQPHHDGLMHKFEERWSRRRDEEP